MSRNKKMDPVAAESCSKRRCVIYVALALMAVLVPMGLAKIRAPFLGYSSVPEYAPFEYMGFLAITALFIITFMEVRQRRDAGLAGILPVVVSALVCSHFIVSIAEFSRVTFDYRCYENAAKSLTLGRNLYVGNHYFYPPFIAEFLAAGHGLVVAAGHKAHIGMSDMQSWGAVFYAWQYLQCLLTIAAYFLSLRFMRNVGASGLLPVLFVAGIFVFNSPLARALRFNQVSLWVLCGTMVVLSLSGRRARLSGSVLAVAALVKLYPLVLLLPLTLARRWRVIVSFAAATVVILCVETSFGRHWDTWRRFVEFLPTFPKGHAFRDNGLHGVIYNCARFISGAFGVKSGTVLPIVDVLWHVAVLVAACLVLIRIVRRERSASVCRRKTTSAEDLNAVETLRFSGHLMDVVVLSMLVAPIVQEHHYVLAIPVILFAFIARDRSKLWFTAAGTMLILLPPTFDVFPFSYHRLVGLLMLVASTPAEINLAGYRSNLLDFSLLTIGSGKATSENELANADGSI